MNDKNVSINLQILMLNDLLNSKVIDNKIYNEALNKIRKLSDGLSIEIPNVLATA